MIRSYSSTVASASGPPLPMPATFRTASTLPNASSAAANIASTSASCETSAWNGTNASPSSSAVSCSRPLTSAPRTRAPSRTNTRAEARAMPEPAPVMTATFPSSSPMRDVLPRIGATAPTFRAGARRAYYNSRMADPRQPPSRDRREAHTPPRRGRADHAARRVRGGHVPPGRGGGGPEACTTTSGRSTTCSSPCSAAAPSATSNGCTAPSLRPQPLRSVVGARFRPARHGAAGGADSGRQPPRRAASRGSEAGPRRSANADGHARGRSSRVRHRSPHEFPPGARSPPRCKAWRSSSWRIKCAGSTRPTRMPQPRWQAHRRGSRAAEAELGAIDSGDALS